MLRWRVLTALVLAPLALWMVWLAPTGVLPVAFLLIVALAAHEMLMLAGLKGERSRVLVTAAVAGLAAALAVSPIDPAIRVGFGTVAWLSALGWMVAFAAGRRVNGPVTLRAVAGAILIIAAYDAMVALHLRPTDGAYWITVLFVLVWGSDIGGYFVGRTIGRHRLAPRVSPGKTWEGALGGLILGLLAATLCQFTLPGAPPAHPGMLAAGALVVVVAIGGDLFESMLKRQAGVKDSSHLLPGHGGVLDRVDALIAAAPPLAFIVMLAD